MPKLSATAGILDTEEVPRTDLTPELISTMTDGEIAAWLLNLRGNREVSMGKPKGERSERSSGPKKEPAKKDKSSAADDIFE